MLSAFRQLGVGLAVFTAGLPSSPAASRSPTRPGRFEQGLAAVGAVTRATAQQLRMLRDAVIEAGSVTQFSPDEAVEGLQSLATAGQTAEQATRTLIPVLDLAAGSLGQLGVAQGAEAVVGTLNAYGMCREWLAFVAPSARGFQAIQEEQMRAELPVTGLFHPFLCHLPPHSS